MFFRVLPDAPRLPTMCPSTQRTVKRKRDSQHISSDSDSDPSVAAKCLSGKTNSSPRKLPHGSATEIEAPEKRQKRHHRESGSRHHAREVRLSETPK